MKLTSTNPAKNYQTIGDVEVSTNEDVLSKVAKAQATKKAWREMGLSKRIELLKPVQTDFAKRQEEIAQLITQEIGKPIQQARSEAKGYAEEFLWFLDNVPEALKDEVTYEDNSSEHKIVYEPFGVAAVITPWNYPFGMATWGIVPNLAVGNTVVFKISEECPLMGKLIEDVFNSHDLPDGVFAEVYGAGDVGKQLSESNINLVWFTGSSHTGKSLYKTAADKFIKAILEMGGSNPCIVFDDVDIPTTASLVYGGRFSNCGQVCDATKRLIVHKSIKDKLLAALKTELESKKVGDPANEDTDIGSLVAKRQLNLLDEQVADATSKGATVAAQLPLASALQGAYYPTNNFG